MPKLYRFAHWSEAKCWLVSLNYVTMIHFNWWKNIIDFLFYCFNQKTKNKSNQHLGFGCGERQRWELAGKPLNSQTGLNLKKPKENIGSDFGPLWPDSPWVSYQIFSRRLPFVDGCSRRVFIELNSRPEEDPADKKSDRWITQRNRGAVKSVSACCMTSGDQRKRHRCTHNKQTWHTHAIRKWSCMQFYIFYEFSQSGHHAF